MQPLGFDPAQVWTDKDNNPGFAPGERASLPDGREYVCMKAGEALGAYDCCVAEDGFDFKKITTVLATSESLVAIAIPQQAIPQDSYGWGITRDDRSDSDTKVNVAAQCPAFVALYTTGTAGRLDDDNGGKAVYGISTRTAQGAGIGTQPCRVVNPRSVVQ